MMPLQTIYGISSDRTAVVYVGITKYRGADLKRRLHGHLAHARVQTARGKASPFHRWLLANVQTLRIRALEETKDPERELAWMKRLRARGQAGFNRNRTVAHNPIYRVTCEECGHKFDIDDESQGRSDYVFGRNGKYRVCASCDFTEGAFASADEEGYNFVMAE